jgi:ubiquitin-conjugating enzyme E2 S
MSNVENLSPQIIRRVSKELQELLTEPPEGIKISVNDDDITDIQAYIEGPGIFFFCPSCFRLVNIYIL